MVNFTAYFYTNYMLHKATGYRGVREDEKNIPAQQYFTQKNPRLFGPYGYKKWKTRYQEKACQGAQELSGFYCFKINRLWAASRFISMRDC